MADDSLGDHGASVKDSAPPALTMDIVFEEALKSERRTPLYYFLKYLFVLVISGASAEVYGPLSIASANGNKSLGYWRWAGGVGAAAAVTWNTLEISLELSFEHFLQQNEKLSPYVEKKTSLARECAVWAIAFLSVVPIAVIPLTDKGKAALAGVLARVVIAAVSNSIPHALPARTIESLLETAFFSARAMIRPAPIAREHISVSLKQKGLKILRQKMLGRLHDAKAVVEHQSYYTLGSDLIADSQNRIDLQNMVWSMADEGLPRRSSMGKKVAYVGGSLFLNVATLGFMKYMIDELSDLTGSVPGGVLSSCLSLLIMIMLNLIFGGQPFANVYGFLCEGRSELHPSVRLASGGAIMGAFVVAAPVAYLSPWTAVELTKISFHKWSAAQKVLSEFAFYGVIAYSFVNIMQAAFRKIFEYIIHYGDQKDQAVAKLLRCIDRVTETISAMKPEAFEGMILALPGFKESQTSELERLALDAERGQAPSAVAVEAQLKKYFGPAMTLQECAQLLSGVVYEPETIPQLRDPGKPGWCCFLSRPGSPHAETSLLKLNLGLDGGN